MGQRYAAETEVPAARSKQAIETLLIQHGASEFVTGWTATHDRLQFHLHNQVIRFTLPRPDPADRAITHDRRGYVRPPAAKQRLIEQLDRQRWRALYLVIRAKIEAVDAGIAIFEQEFLAFIVGPEDLTVGDILIPRLQAGTAFKALTAGKDR
jgi:hypothetical protein